MDLLITIPKTVKWGQWLDECWDVVYHGGTLNYRISTSFNRLPKNTLGGPDDRVYVVHDGFIRGYHHLQDIRFLDGFKCQTTLIYWPAGYYLVRSGGFQSIHPIPHPGFQGWRYYDRDKPLKKSLKEAG